MPDRPVVGAPEIIPNPDPSVVTSGAIDRAVSNATSVMNARIRAVDVRIDAMEKAVELFQSDLTRVPTQLDRAVNGLRDVITAEMQGMRSTLTKETEKLEAVTNQRFEAVGAQFSERDTRTDQRAGDTKLAVDAAFAAANTAMSKIEAGFTKSIDGLQNLLNANAKASDDKISDLKDRLTQMESRTQGISAANSDMRSARQEGHNQQVDSHGNMAIVISVVAVIASIAVSMLLHFMK